MHVHNMHVFANKSPACERMALPFGMPHGAFVRELSKKSKSYFLAGGNVNATCPELFSTHASTKISTLTLKDTNKRRCGPICPPHKTQFELEQMLHSRFWTRGVRSCFAFGILVYYAAHSLLRCKERLGLRLELRWPVLTLRAKWWKYLNNS